MSSLDVVFAPKSVALVGASADPTKWGQWFQEGLFRSAHRRTITLVNRSGRPIDGRPTVPSLRDMPSAPELVVVCVPPEHVPSALDDAVHVGAKAAIVITAGIDAALGDGHEAAAVARAVDAGMRVVGPNCMGMFDADSELQVLWGTIGRGCLAVVSQSGQVGSECLAAATASGLGVSRFVSLGNQRDVGAVEVLHDLVDHDSTRVVALYLETFGDGRRVVEAVQTLRDAGKPTVLLTVGASNASRLAAMSHTGSLTSDIDVIDAACRAAGTRRVASPWELVDAAAVLAGPGRMHGRRVAVLGDSGGQGAVASDLLHAGSLAVPRLSNALQEALAAVLPYTASVGNPVDLGGGGTLDVGNYASLVESASCSGEVDAVLLTGYFGGYAIDNLATEGEALAVERMVRAVRAAEVPLVVHSQVTASPTLDTLHANGIATFPSVDRATRALALAADVWLRPARRPARLGTSVVGPIAGYLGAREALSAHGIRFPAAFGVRSSVEVAPACAAVGLPAALKAAWLAHKSEHEGVILGLVSEADVADALERMRAVHGDGDYVLEAMDGRRNVVEMLVGARRDPIFGPTVMVAAGGTEAEVWQDSTIELAPVDLATAQAMVSRLKSAALLTGWRGRPAVDIDALAQVIVAVSDFAAVNSDVLEVDLNPVRVGVIGAVAVDAFIQLTQPA